MLSDSVTIWAQCWSTAQAAWFGASWVLLAVVPVGSLGVCGSQKNKIETVRAVSAHNRVQGVLEAML